MDKVTLSALETIKSNIRIMNEAMDRWADQLEQLQADAFLTTIVAANSRVDDDDDASGDDLIKDEEEAHQKKLLRIIRSMPHYEPSNCLKEALGANFTNEILAEKDAVFGSYLKTRQLNSDNVASVLRTLLNIEDLSTIKIYSELQQTDVVLTKTSNFRFSFALKETPLNAEDVLAPNMDEVVLIPKASLLASPKPEDALLTFLPHPHEKLKSMDPMCRHVTNLEQVTRTRVLIKFKRDSFPGDSVLGQKYDVIMRSRRMPFRYMYRALHLLDEWPELRSYLFPTLALYKPIAVPAQPAESLALFNERVGRNAEQLQAVQQIVAGPSAQAPYIVFGPPGTGKTTTIVEAILQLRLQQPRSRILVTAGSNSACDTIALRICEYFDVNPRLKAHIAQQAKQSRLVTRDVRPTHQLMRLFSRSIFAKGLNSVNPLLLKHSNCHGKNFGRMEVDHLRQYGIIVATLCTVGRLVTDNLGKFDFFTHIFIDEAGASTEPESLVGIMGIKQHPNCHVILSGDHKQLGAVIKSDRAASLGLEHSLMERLLRGECYSLDANGNYDHTLQARLRRNYRSHPEIVRLYNTLYYNNELIAEAPPADVNLAAKWPMLPNPEFPIIFQATHGRTERAANSTSSFNALEAQVLKWYVQRLLNNRMGGVRVQEQDIGIVAPYAAQCKLITESMRKLGYNNIEVGSVEAYQGREKPIIVVSLVRSFANMGFVRNPRRLNVLLSRAKSLLILIGNPVTLRHHRDFKFIINECKSHGNYLFKKKDVQLWQKLLLQNKKSVDELEDETESESDSDTDSDVEIIEAGIPWCAKMPEDITVAVTPIAVTDDSSSCITIEESSSESEDERHTVSEGAIESDPGKISIHSTFLKVCAGAPKYVKQKLCELEFNCS